MYLHECYVVPKAALIAVVEYLRKRPFDEVAGLLAGLDGSPEGTAKELAKAGVKITNGDEVGIAALAYWDAACETPERDGSLPIPGETVVDFPAGVARRE